MFNKPRLLTPGPTPLPERVRLALAKDMIHHRKSEFMAIMGRVQEGLRTLFGTAGTVLPLTSSGTGAMTAAVYNLFAPGEKVLVGKRMTRVYYHLEEPGHRRLQELVHEYQVMTRGVFQIIQRETDAKEGG